MRIVISTLSILFAAMVIIVSIINYTEHVTVKLWPDQVQYTYADTSVSWVIFFSAFAGSLFMGIIAVLEGSKTRLSNARLKTQVRRLQQEIQTLKRQPGEVPARGTSRGSVPSESPEIEPAEIESEELEPSDIGPPEIDGEETP
jgi:hypothetical protein